LVGSEQGDHLASFLVELREEPSRNAFPINDHPQHSNLAYRLLKAVEHLR
jgi:hypothetical protein